PARTESILAPVTSGAGLTFSWSRRAGALREQCQECDRIDWRRGPYKRRGAENAHELLHAARLCLQDEVHQRVDQDQPHSIPMEVDHGLAGITKIKRASAEELSRQGEVKHPVEQYIQGGPPRGLGAKKAR